MIRYLAVVTMMVKTARFDSMEGTLVYEEESDGRRTWFGGGDVEVD